jgi:hypothetical protein
MKVRWILPRREYPGSTYNLKSRASLPVVAARYFILKIIYKKKQDPAARWVWDVDLQHVRRAGRPSGKFKFDLST